MNVIVSDKARDYIRDKSQGDPEVTVAVVSVSSG
jgi:hypothetical protein